MWREYTRETPARPGLAIIMAALALAGTTALAWVMTHRANPKKEVKLSHWPISFNLPEGLELTYLDNQGSQYPFLSDGTRGQAIFRAAGDLQSDTAIEVTYLLLEEGSTLDDACNTLIGDEGPPEAESISFGGFDGVVIATLTPSVRPRLTETCVGIHPCGLAVRFIQSLELDDYRRLGRFERMLFSTRMIDWTSPKPPWIDLSNRLVSS